MGDSLLSQAPPFSSAVDNARFAGSGQLWLLDCAQIQIIDVFHHVGLTLLSMLGELMIQVKENINLKCLAVEDCLTGHYRAWADYVCWHGPVMV